MKVTKPTKEQIKKVAEKIAEIRKNNKLKQLKNNNEK